MLKSCRRHWLLLVLFAFLLLQGCLGRKPVPEPVPVETTLDVYLAASKDANSSAGQSARPIAVWFYSLKTTGRFSSADFYSLYDRDSEVLGGDLLSKEEVIVEPGGGQRLSFPVTPDAAYLGVVAAFRDIDRAQWRDLVPIKPNHANRVSLTIESNAIRVASRSEG